MSRFRALTVLALFLAACATPPTAVPSATSTTAATMTLTPTPTATPTPAFTSTPRPSPTLTPIPPTATHTPTPTPLPTATTLPSDLWIGPSDLSVHPDGDAYYSGDLISFQVYPHHGHDWSLSSPPDVDVEIWLGPPGGGQLIVKDRAAFYGGKDGEALMAWAWDTTGLVGPQRLSVILDPDDEIQIGDEDLDNNLVTHTIDLLPLDQLPEAWADARWIEQSSECCVFHYIDGSAADRDIEALMALADESIASVGDRLGEETDQIELDVYLIDRVLGHGGFAADEVIISYLDRFYPGGQLAQVLRHEGAHVLDRQFAEIRPALLAEGLAVYISGGHFRPEPITERASALLALERYIPLAVLADDFYPSQHEIGYLEAAAFVAYLVDRFGWDDFKAFYGDIPDSGAGQSAMIDAGLREHFGLTLDQAEAEWLSMLRAFPTLATQVTDLRLSIEFYDTVRRYQQKWDPSAYFRQVWLPAIKDAAQRGITADWLRHPGGPVNVTLETMFVAAGHALDDAAYARAEALLGAINVVLDAGGDLTTDPLAEEYGALAQATAATGHEAQQIFLDPELDQARVLATPPNRVDIVELAFFRSAGVWRVTAWGN